VPNQPCQLEGLLRSSTAGLETTLSKLQGTVEDLRAAAVAGAAARAPSAAAGAEPTAAAPGPGSAAHARGPDWDPQQGELVKQLQAETEELRQAKEGLETALSACQQELNDVLEDR
jgi:hypothetical protein